VAPLFSKRNRPFLYGVIWAAFVFFGLTALEYQDPALLMDNGTILMIASLLIGIYAAYPVVMWINHKIPNAWFGLWMKRIVAGVLGLGGVAMACVCMMSSSIAFLSMKTGPHVSMTVFSVFVASFFVGISIFSGYLEFEFERRSGRLVYYGRQRF
jgi:hypothetical protein